MNGGSMSDQESIPDNSRIALNDPVPSNSFEQNIVRAPARFASLVMGSAVYIVIGGILVWKNPTIQSYVREHLWLPAILVAMVVAMLVLAWVRRDFITASAKKQIGVIIFVAMPLLLVLVGAVWFLPDRFQVLMLRMVFLLIVCLLPAVLYYLFIASRKSSLLQEFVANLFRLGLLRRQSLAKGNATDIEPEVERRVRIMSYIQKFEAAYGPIPEQSTLAILNATDPDSSSFSLPDLHKKAIGAGWYFSPETSIPVVLATLLIGLGWFLTLPPWEVIVIAVDGSETEKLSNVLRPNPIPVHFAFLGAYFFSLQMLFRRFVRKDLNTNAYLAVTLRIILAVLGTWILLEAAGILNIVNTTFGKTDPALLVMGFVVGAFPPVAWQMIQSAFRTLTGARFLVPSLRTAMPVSDLDGLTIWHQARLEEEDIENVPNMASADMVELMLSTRVPPERIVDWVDQAILYTHLKDSDKNLTPVGDERAQSDRQLLRAHGIHNASAFLAAYEKSEERQDRDLFEALLPGNGRSRIRSLADTLVNNSNLCLVRRWRRIV